MVDPIQRDVGISHLVLVAQTIPNVANCTVVLDDGTQRLPDTCDQCPRKWHFPRGKNLLLLTSLTSGGKTSCFMVYPMNQMSSAVQYP